MSSKEVTELFFFSLTVWIIIALTLFILAYSKISDLKHRFNGLRGSLFKSSFLPPRDNQSVSGEMAQQVMVTRAQTLSWVITTPTRCPMSFTHSLCHVM